MTQPPVALTPIDDIAYQATPDFVALCRDFGFDPSLPLDGQMVSLSDARQFWFVYEARKRVLTGMTAAAVARDLHDAVRDREPTTSADLEASVMRAVSVTGERLVVQAPNGSLWECTVAPSTE